MVSNGYQWLQVHGFQWLLFLQYRQCPPRTCRLEIFSVVNKHLQDFRANTKNPQPFPFTQGGEAQEQVHHILLFGYASPSFSVFLIFWGIQVLDCILYFIQNPLETMH